MVDKIIQDYKSYLKDNFDPVRAVKEKAYLYSDLKHYGVSAQKSKAFFRTNRKALKGLSKKDALKLVKKLWKQPSHEERNFGVGVLNLHSDKLKLSDMPLIEKLMIESKGWALLDNLIIPIMPVMIKKDPRAYSYLKKWAKEDDYWVRRSAILAQLLFFRRNENGDKDLFFRLSEKLFDESWIDKVYPNKGLKSTEQTKLQNKRAKFFIRKAIGWALREMSTKDPKSAYKFLLKNRGKMSGLTFREGSRKLPDRYKNKLKI